MTIETSAEKARLTVQSGGEGPASAKGDVSEVDPQFKHDVAQVVGDLDLTHCFQCGVCSGSCPTMTMMEYGPRKIMHMIHLGMADRVLRSPDIWLCVSCFSCAARCPQGIEVTDVMSALRNMAVARGLTKDKEATFSKIFITVLREHGRMYEPEVLMRYYASVLDVESMIKIVPLGVRMFLKSKIGLLPERIKNAREMAQIAARVSEEEER